MDFAVSHDFAEETMEAKARWFQSLTMEQRMAVFCSFMDLIFAINPHIADFKDAEQLAKGIPILSRP
jgi:hypothetical protein